MSGRRGRYSTGPVTSYIWYALNQDVASGFHDCSTTRAKHSLFDGDHAFWASAVPVTTLAAHFMKMKVISSHSLSPISHHSKEQSGRSFFFNL